MALSGLASGHRAGCHSPPHACNTLCMSGVILPDTEKHHIDRDTVTVSCIEPCPTSPGLSGPRVLQVCEKSAPASCCYVGEADSFRPHESCAMLVYAVGVPQPAGVPRPAQELAHQVRGGLSGHASSTGSPLSCHSIPDPADAHKVPGIQLLLDTVQSQVVVPSHQYLISWSRVKSYACSNLQV